MTILPASIDASRTSRDSSESAFKSRVVTRGTSCFCNAFEEAPSAVTTPARPDASVQLAKSANSFAKTEATPVGSCSTAVANAFTVASRTAKHSCERNGSRTVGDWLSSSSENDTPAFA